MWENQHLTKDGLGNTQSVLLLCAGFLFGADIVRIYMTLYQQCILIFAFSTLEQRAPQFTFTRFQLSLQSASRCRVRPRARAASIGSRRRTVSHEALREHLSLPSRFQLSLQSASRWRVRPRAASCSRWWRQPRRRTSTSSSHCSGETAPFIRAWSSSATLLQRNTSICVLPMCPCLVRAWSHTVLLLPAYRFYSAVRVLLLPSSQCGCCRLDAPRSVCRPFLFSCSPVRAQAQASLPSLISCTLFRCAAAARSASCRAPGTVRACYQKRLVTESALRRIL